ncbi:MAG: AraC family transcriptional regulator [Actinomycetota bacterium]|nr:AraC family transcriptional regulator [Actinomycetota bacterium]
MSLISEDIHRRLLRARDAMDRTYPEPLDVAALARVALMSPAHFIREFKRVFGEPPYRYLQRRRVERAMFLLQHRDDSVTDICMTVGFSSLGTFSRTFAAIVGESPTGYRLRTKGLPHVAPTSFAMRWNRPSSFGEAPPDQLQ